jgi:hypothetical protein
MSTSMRSVCLPTSTFIMLVIGIAERYNFAHKAGNFAHESWLAARELFRWTGIWQAQGILSPRRPKQKLSLD